MHLIRRHWSSVMFALLTVMAPRATRAQVGSTTDILTGRVMSPDGKPLAGARVEATSVETGITRSRTTNADGRYTILFPDGGDSYQMTIRFIGYAPAQFTLARQADEDRLVADVRLSPVATQLGPVVVRGNAATGRREQPGPGSVERTLTGDQLQRLPIDPTDLAALASLTPGVVAITGTDSTAASFSVAGQRPDQNQVTLDGLSFLGGTNVPTEAVRQTRIITNTYDVSRGQFTGGQVATTTRGGTNQLSGSFAYALRDPSLEFGTDQSTPTTFGQGYTQYQLSGGIGGPIIQNKLLYFGAFQVRRRLDPLQTITGADPITLERLGLEPDSATRFRDLVGGYGIPLSVPSIPQDRLSDNGTAIMRVDYHVNDDHSLMLRGNWQGSLQEAFRTSAFALPTHGGTQHTGGGGAMLALSSVLGNFLNEVRATYSRNLNSADGYLDDPEGRVSIASSLGDTTLAVTQLDFGGNSGLPTDGANGQFEGTDEFSWMSDDASHRFKLGALLNLTSFSSMNAFNSSGTFVFNSLEDLQNDQPAMFTRSLMPVSRTGSGLNSAIYLGDTWRQSRALQVTYGVRVEGSDFQGHPAFNPDIEKLFGYRTDKFPTEVAWSPRAGFTWMLGGNSGGQIPQGGFGGRGGGFGRGAQIATGFGGNGGGSGPQPYIIRGGLGEFRGTFPLPMFASALTATGLPNSQSQLVCIGADVPTPDWADYLSDPSTIPATCANGAGSNPAFSNQRPSVTVFEPDFGAPRSWRGSLGVSHRLGVRLGASIDFSYALGTNLYSVRDLNLNTTPRFTLPLEGNRPVFVDTSAIVPSTGAISLLSSRLYDQYAQVLDVTSGLQSKTGQVTLSLNGVTPNDILWTLSYTFTRSVDQSSFYNAGGFGGGGAGAGGGFGSPTTAGNPNEFPWATSDFERRHAFVGSTTWLVNSWLDLTSVLRLTSGAPFTPRVSADINGDGSRNDRAFIFDPNSPLILGDTALVNGMRRLLTNGPGDVRACLEKQLGQIAGRNSCVGSWTPQIDLQANLRPKLGGFLGQRLMISVAAINPLAGLDQLLHGSNNLRGWGQPNRADPTLLYVRGFDPVQERFIYLVNDRFGDNPASRTAIRTPFQLALTARLQVGPDRQRQLLEGTLRGINGRGGRGGFDIRTIVNRVAPNPVDTIIAMKDTLQLTADQLAKLQLVADSLRAENDTLISTIQQQLAKGQGGADLAAVFPNIQPKLQQARNNYLAAIKRAQAILTPVQWSRLPDAIRNPSLQRGFRRGAPRP